VGYRSLTESQVAQFREDGYVRAGKLLDDAQTESLRSEYDRIFAEARSDGRFRNLASDASDDDDANSGTKGQMLQITQMCERSLLFRRLLFDDRILDIVEDLIGPNIQLFHDQALYKPAHNGEAVFWHQDNAYWQCFPAQLVSCWLTLDDVDVDNGAMQVIPRSHLKAVEHHKSEDSSVLFDIGGEVDPSNAIVVDLPAGGAMFHHCQTLHYTQPNRTDRQRRAFAIHFMPPGTRRKEIGFLEVSFSRPLLRARI
jgi:ectoine hydroxylase-related dioxygenase (phytanoyl-CoA dioxygenase family)